MSHVDPNAVPGRVGSSYAIMSLLSEANGCSCDYNPSEKSARRVMANRDFPCFVAENSGAATSGKFYYEAVIDAPGTIQVGFILQGKFSQQGVKCLEGKGNGVGDDTASWGFDGAKKAVLSKAKVADATEGAKAKGDVIGCALDLDAKTIQFSVNGKNATAAPVSLTANDSKYADGDVVLPAISVNGKSAALLNFEADELKFLPAGFSAWQPSAFPFAGLTSGSKKAPADSKTDALSLANSQSDISSALAVLSNAASSGEDTAAKDVKRFVEGRGGFFEYGLDYQLGSRFGTSADAFAKLIQGSLPKLECKPKKAEDVLKAGGDFSKALDVRRAIVHTLLSLAAAYPNQKAAGELGAKIQGQLEKFDAIVGDVMPKLLYIQAIEDKSQYKVHSLQYGYYYAADRFTPLLEKPREKMKPAELDKHVAEIHKQAGMFQTWREWFVKESQQPGGFAGELADAHLKVVDTMMEKYNAEFDPSLMAAEGAEKQKKTNLEALKKEIERWKKNMEDGDKEFARFPERCEEKYRKINEALQKYEDEFAAAVSKSATGDLDMPTLAKLGPSSEVESDDFRDFASEFRGARYVDWVDREERRLLQRKADNETREITSLYKLAYSDADHSRHEMALEKISKGDERRSQLESEPGFMELDSVVAKMIEFEDLRDKAVSLVEKKQRDRKCHQLAMDLSHALSQSMGDLDHHRYESGLQKHRKAKDIYETQINNLDAPSMEHEKIKDVIEKYAEIMPKFKQEYHDKVVGKEAREKTSHLRGKVKTGIIDMIYHSRETEALTAAQEVEDGLNTLKQDPLLSSHALVMELADELLGDGDGEPAEEGAEEGEKKKKQTYNLAALRRQAEQKIIDREAKERLRVFNQAFKSAESDFEHCRFETALQNLQKYRELAAELEKEERFKGREDVETALGESDSKILEFEQTYRDKMARRAFDEQKRNANSALNSAKHDLDHSKYETCMVQLTSFKEKIGKMEQDETFCDGGALAKERDEYIVEAQKGIDEFIAAYTDKVVSRKASDAARELHSLAKSCESDVEHHRDESFLENLNKFKLFASGLYPVSTPLGEEPWLVYNHQVTQDALSEACKKQFELQTRFEEQQFEKRINKMVSEVRTHVKQGEHDLDHCVFERCLEHLSKANDALVLLSLVANERAASEAATAAASIEAIKQKYSEVMSKRRDDDLNRAVKSALNSAKSAFEHYRNEQTLTDLEKAREAIDDLEARGSAAGQSTVAGYNEEIKKLEQQYSDRVLTKEATTATKSISADLEMSKSHLSHTRIEKALESLSAAREKAAVLSSNDRLTVLAQISEFLASLDTNSVETAIVEKQLERERTESVRKLKSGVNELKSHFSHHRDAQSLEANSKISEELLPALLDDSRFAEHAEVVAASQEAKEAQSSFAKDYQERVVSKKFSEFSSAFKNKVKESENALSSCNFTTALECFNAARETLGRIGGDDLMVGYAPAEELIKAGAAELEKVGSAIEAKQQERALSNAKRDVNSKLNEAKSKFEHHNHEASLESLSKAREFLNEYEVTYGSGDAFVGEKKGEISVFEVEYANKIFEQELSRRERKINSLTAAARSSYEHNRLEDAMTKIAEGDEAAQQLGSDERFLHLDRVSAFINEHNSAVSEVRNNITQKIADKKSREEKSHINTAIVECNRCFDHHQFDNCLVAATKAAELIDESSLPDSELADFRQRLSTFRKTFAESRLTAEANASIRSVHSILKNIEFLINHCRFEDALGELQKARDEASKLGDAKFEELGQVADFFASWPGNYSALSQKIEDKLTARAFNQAQHNVTTALKCAEQGLAHKVHNTAMESVQKARDAISELTSEFPNSDRAVSVCAQYAQQADEISRKIADELFAREVATATRNIQSKITRAHELFERCAYTECLEAFNSAKELAKEAQDDERLSSSSVLKAFLGSFEAQANKFALNYATTALQNDARAASTAVKQALSNATLYLSRNARERCLEELAKAQEKFEENFGAESNSMLKTLPIAQETFESLKAAHEKIANQFLTKDSDDSMRKAMKIVGSIKNKQTKLIDCAEDFENLKTLLQGEDGGGGAGALLGSHEKQPVSQLYSALAGVNKFILLEIVPLFRAAKVPLFDDAASSSSSKKGAKKGGNTDSLEDPFSMGKTLGSRWPQLSDIRKNALKQIPVGPSVHPRYFSALKVTNQQALNINKLLKEVERDVASSCFSGDPESPDQKESAGRSCYPFVDKMLQTDHMERFLREFSKGLRTLEKDVAHAKIDINEDEFSQALLKNFAAFSEAWSETVSHFKGIEKQLLRFRAAVRVLRNLKDKCFVKAQHGSGEFMELLGDHPTETVLFIKWWDLQPSVAQPSSGSGKKTLHKSAYQFSSVPANEQFMLLSRCAVRLAEDLRRYDKEYLETFCPGVEQKEGPQGGIYVSLIKQFLQLDHDSRREHGQRCYRRLAELSMGCAEGRHTDEIGAWFEAAERYPLARKFGCIRGNSHSKTWKVQWSEPDYDDTLIDPEANNTAITPDLDEKQEWYDFETEWTFCLQDPAVFGAPANFHKQRKDLSNSGSADLWTPICKQNATKIVFSQKDINKDGSVADGGSFSDKFNLGDITSSGLCARGFWPRAVAAYPIAKEVKTGKLLYAHEHMGGGGLAMDHKLIMKMCMKGFIDGKPIEYDEMVEQDNSWTPNSNIITAFDEKSEALSAASKSKGGSSGGGGGGNPYARGGGGGGSNSNNNKNDHEEDFYAYKQTCKFHVLADDLHDPRQLRDPWHRVAGRFAYEFSKLSAGDHKVELQLCVRILSSSENTFAHPVVDKKSVMFPTFSTPVSAPIASGSFTLVVPSQKVPRLSILPAFPTPALTKTSAATRAECEKLIVSRLNSDARWGGRTPKNERAFYSMIRNDSHVVTTDVFWKDELGNPYRDGEGHIIGMRENTQYGRDCFAAFRRFKKDEWKREKVAIFSLVAAAPHQRKPPTDILPNQLQSFFVTSGYYFQVDACMLSEADLKLLEALHK